jgi:hypothetical protein
MNTWEQFHIHRLSRDGLQLNDTYADTHNPIFRLTNSYSQQINTDHPSDGNTLPLTPFLPSNP